jgi:integrase
LVANPRTPIDRNHNKETLELAKKIRFEKEQEFLNDREGYRLKKKSKVNLLEYFADFAERANVADRLVLVGALKNFKDFLKEEYPQYANSIEARNINKEMIQRFVDFLVDNHKGQGAETYYKRFKRLMNYAVDHDIIRKSPCKGVTTSKLGDMLAKDILSDEELKTLFETHYQGENPEIRRAFAVTCLCGIRRCDIVKLTYSNVDYSNKILKYRQSKTEAHSNSSGVTIPLNDTLLELIGTKKDDAKDDLIFHLPSDTMCLKALRTWTKRAGIDKHITWHCGRHSFATL